MPTPADRVKLNADLPLPIQQAAKAVFPRGTLTIAIGLFIKAMAKAHLRNPYVAQELVGGQVEVRIERKGKK